MIKKSLLLISLMVSCAGIFGSDNQDYLGQFFTGPKQVRNQIMTGLFGAAFGASIAYCSSQPSDAPMLATFFGGLSILGFNTIKIVRQIEENKERIKKIKRE